MTSFKLAVAARKDFKNIAKYTQNQWGKQQRYFYMKSLDETFQFLAEHQNSGAHCSYIYPELRKHRHKQHTIYYLIKADHIFIVRILHSSMDVKTQLLDL